MFALIVVALLCLAGCTSAPAVKTPPTVFVTVSPSPTADAGDDAATTEPTDDPTVDPTDEPTDAPTPTSEDLDPGDGSSATATALPLNKQGTPLALGDFFNTESSWSEGSYSIAGKNGIQGISYVIDACGTGSGASIELRLADHFKTLKFSVGQDDASQQGNQTIVVSVVGNGKQLADGIKNVPFNKISTFPSLSVTMVNSLVINIYLDDQIEDCDGSVRAVLYDIVLG